MTTYPCDQPEYAKPCCVQEQSACAIPPLPSCRCKHQQQTHLVLPCRQWRRSEPSIRLTFECLHLPISTEGESVQVSVGFVEKLAHVKNDESFEMDLHGLLDQQSGRCRYIILANKHPTYHGHMRIIAMRGPLAMSGPLAMNSSTNSTMSPSRIRRGSCRESYSF